MSNREELTVTLFKSTTYRREAGYTYRLHEVIRDSYFTEDGGYVPQRVVYTRESQVIGTDADADTAEAYCDELERAEIEGSFG